MLQYPDKAYIDPVHIQSHDQHAYCNAVEEELDGEPWFLDIKRYIQSREYPAYATNDQKRTIRHLASGFLLRSTPYLLVYGTEAIIPTEVEIPSLRVIVETEIDDDEWVKTRLEHLSLIEEKRLMSMCHGQLYQMRMAQAYNKKVYPRNFDFGQLVLRRILPHLVEAKGKFSLKWQGPFVVNKVLPNGALYLTDVEGKMAINADAVKRYYV
ncbi:hypothetical protein CQW23_17646 [Capsicum baccatum]|uniref:Uncharacterized protein n=1 Tax=Capsicum baccatum TaxID=33114 RepID=A0A2G2WEG0_CAPBA|nr:hypothetical protein CQW23_17646 [Capsicum baccatum]